MDKKIWIGIKISLVLFVFALITYVFLWNPENIETVIDIFIDNLL